MFFNAAIFDLDDTLYNYEVCHKAAIEKIAKLLEIEHIKFIQMYNSISNQLKYQLGYTASSHNRFIYFKQLKEKYNLKYDITAINYFYWDAYLENMKLFDGVIDTLKFLKQNNIKICLLTDFLTEYQFKKLNNLEILDYFDVIVTSEEVGVEKPSISSFQYCLGKLNEPANKVIMIGDSNEKDIEGAINAGIYPFHFMKPVWISSIRLTVQYDRTLFSSFKDLFSFLTKTHNDINELSKLCRYFGERFDLTQAGGGNISIKGDELMLIKSSGVNLSNVNHKENYSVILNKSYGTNGIFYKGLNDDVLNGDYKNISDYNIISKNRASMETYMHSYLDKYTIHLHPIQVNKILVRKDARQIIEKLFTDSIFIDYAEPGIELSKKILELVRNPIFGDKIIFLANHGLIVSTNEYSKIKELIKNIIDKCEEYLDDYYTEYSLMNNISDITTSMDHVKDRNVSYLSEDILVNILMRNINKLNFRSIFPDKVIYCGTDYVDMLEPMSNEEHKEKFSGRTQTIFIANNKICISSSSLEKCREIESVLKAHLLIIDNNDNINYLDKDDEDKLLGMEAEKYRQKV